MSGEIYRGQNGSVAYGKEWGLAYGKQREGLVREKTHLDVELPVRERDRLSVSEWVLAHPACLHG